MWIIWNYSIRRHTRWGLVYTWRICSLNTQPNTIETSNNISWGDHYFAQTYWSIHNNALIWLINGDHDDHGSSICTWLRNTYKSKPFLVYEYSTWYTLMDDLRWFRFLPSITKCLYNASHNLLINFNNWHSVDEFFSLTLVCLEWFLKIYLE